MAATEKTSPDSGFPTPHDVLKWCAETHPKIWFPSEYAQDTGMPREQINEPLWILRQAGLVKVVDWVRGKGQGFTLTPAGEVALTEPGLIPTTLPPSATVTHDVPSAIPPTSGETIPDVPSRTATTFERGEQAREAVYGRRRTLVTPILIAFNVAWFLLGGIAAWRMGVSSSEYLQGESSEVLLRIGAVSGLSLLDGQWWRLLSSGWVHIGILHLLANMIGLMILGPMAEMMWGRPRFLLIYLLSGLSASCLAMALEPNAVLAGASGSIWGMMTAITVWVVRVRSHLPPSAEMQSLFRGLMTVLLINFVASAAPGVSWQGHFGGGLAGIIMAFLMEPLRGRYRTPLHRALVLTGLMVLTITGPTGVYVLSQQSESWIRLRNAQRMRPRLTLEPVRWQRVRDTYTQVVTARVQQTPDTLQNARITVERLAADVLTAQQHLGELTGQEVSSAEEYLHQLDQLIARMQETLHAAHALDAAGWKALVADQEAVEQAWNRLIASTAPVTPAE